MSTIRIVQREGAWHLYTEELSESGFRAACMLASEHVVVESFCPILSPLWTDLTVQLLPSLRPEVLSVRRLELDLRLTREEFVRSFSLWSHADTVTAWFIGRRCPDTLRIMNLPESRRFQILRSVGFTLEFEWPMAAIGDWVRFTSLDEDLIRKVAAALEES